MSARSGFAWFGSAVLATLILLHPGFDTSEGADHARTAMHWMETGRLGNGTPPSSMFLQGPDGLHYTLHELGNTLWTMPAAAAGLLIENLSGQEHIADADARVADLVAAFFAPVIVTLTALGFWKWLEWGFAASPRLRLGASALLVFATMLLPYSRFLGDVVATGCWLTWGAAFAARAAVRSSRGAAAAAGLCLGCAFLTRVPAVVAIVPIFAAMLAAAPARSRWRLGAFAIAAALPCAAGAMWFNDIRTGSPFVPAFLLPQFALVQPGHANIAEGVAGLLFSPGKSVFLFSPVLLLAAVGLPRLWREARVQAGMVIAVLVLFLALHGSSHTWDGDWAWGPRYFVFIVPIVWLPAAFALTWLLSGNSVRRRMTVLLIAASVAVQLSAIVINWHYQYQLMSADGRLHDGTYWIADNQFTDGMRAAAMNLARMAGVDVPVREPEGMSRTTVLASTGVNVWWVTALRAGFKPLVILPVVAALALFAAFAWRRALHSIRS